VTVYASKATTIPGFDALAQSVATGNEEAKSITLSAKAWSDTTTPKFTIASQPQHGTLSAIAQGNVTYTPSAGYAGADSFTFSAADPTSQFPTSPAVATVSVEVGEAVKIPSVAIEGAPETIETGMSVQLSAHVANDSPTVAWATSGGSITQGGLFTAPSKRPAADSVTVSATTSKGAKDQRTIAIAEPPPVEPAPESPPLETPTVTPPDETTTSSSGSATGSNAPSGETSSSQQTAGGSVLGEQTAKARIAVDRPTVVLLGRTLVMTARPTGPGAIRLSAFVGGRRVGSCVTLTPADRSFTCRVRLGSGISSRARIRVQATLRDGSALARSVRAAAPVEQMQMAHGAQAGLAAAFWCSPAALRSFAALR
jgi:hypothetical protein